MDTEGPQGTTHRGGRFERRRNVPRRTGSTGAARHRTGAAVGGGVMAAATGVPVREVDVLIVGASLSAAAAAKRTVDAGLETVILERKELPRHKICSGILSPRGHRFLLENFGPLPREALHEPTSCRGVTFHFPSMVSLSMDFFGGTTPHLHRKFSDHWAIKQSGAEVHDRTSFAGLEHTGD